MKQIITACWILFFWAGLAWQYKNRNGVLYGDSRAANPILSSTSLTAHTEGDTFYRYSPFYVRRVASKPEYGIDTLYRYISFSSLDDAADMDTYKVDTFYHTYLFQTVHNKTIDKRIKYSIDTFYGPNPVFSSAARKYAIDSFHRYNPFYTPPGSTWAPQIFEGHKLHNPFDTATYPKAAPPYSIDTFYQIHPFDSTGHPGAVPRPVIDTFYRFYPDRNLFKSIHQHSYFYKKRKQPANKHS